jgi:hypothetical protein
LLWWRKILATSTNTSPFCYYCMMKDTNLKILCSNDLKHHLQHIYVVICNTNM